MSVEMLAELEKFKVPVEQVRPFPGNARVGQIPKIVKSIEDHDQYRPLVVNLREGTEYGDMAVLAGNQTLKALQQLERSEVYVWYVDVDDDEALEINLVDNATSDEAYNDPELLAILLQKATSTERAGYSDEFLGDLLVSIETEPEEGLTDPDDIPEAPTEPVSKPGDLWILGEHRLLCGDSTNPEQVGRLMDGARATLMATDPPYLVDYDGSNHSKSDVHWSLDRKQLWDAYRDHAASVEFYRDFLAAALEVAITESAPVYQWHADLRRDLVRAAWAETGLLAHQTIIWVKNNSVLTRSHFMWQHEPALYGWKKGKQPREARRPPANASTVWNIARDSVHNDLHPTAKPVELFERPVGWHTRPGEVCYEPFAGSGSQLIACQMLGRRCYAVEIAPEYCDVICRRFQEFTGIVPILEATGEEHDFTSDPTGDPVSFGSPHESPEKSEVG